MRWPRPWGWEGVDAWPVDPFEEAERRQSSGRCWWFEVPRVGWFNPSAESAARPSWAWGQFTERGGGGMFMAVCLHCILTEKIS